MTEPDLHELAQLVRLRALRTSAAAQACAQCARAVEALQDAVARREARVAEWRAMNGALARYVLGPGAADCARFSAATAARRAHLVEQEERDESALYDELHDLRAARARLVEAQARWAREREREAEVRQRLRGAGAADALRRDEREAPELPAIAWGGMIR